MTKMEALAMKTIKVTTNSSYIYDPSRAESQK